MTKKIFDTNTLKDIINITATILYENFFYDELSVNEFVDTFSNRIVKEFAYIHKTADKEFVTNMLTDKQARAHFTCYFTSVHLRTKLIMEMNFTEQELEAFETILPKYTGETKRENQPKSR